MGVILKSSKTKPMRFKPVIFWFIVYLMMVNAGQVNAQTTDYHNSLNSYSFDLYRETKIEKKNLFLSPLSTYYSLLMAYEGSKNETKQEFEKVLYLKSSDPLKNEYLHGFASKSDGSSDVKVSNAIWLDKNLQVEEGFRKRVTDKYFADFKRADFADAQSAASDINDWITEKTNQRINEIAAAGDISPDTQFLIANAVYFKGEWLNKFDGRKTDSGLFYTDIENQYKIDFMRKTEQLRYFENEESQFISKPYKDSDMSFCILLPRELFGISDLEEKMNDDFLDKILDNATYTNTALSIPKFKLEGSYDLSDALINSGLKSAFSSQADFSGIIKSAPVMLGKVLHKTWFELDEEKTEAAAATSIVMIGRAAPSYKVFKADHPFVFFVIDNRTRAILFMGRYVEPIYGKKVVEDEENLASNLENRKKEKLTIGAENNLLFVANEKIISPTEFKAINPG